MSGIKAKKTAESKIEPSGIIVLPDAAVQGTDQENIQIKELRPEGSDTKWLAMHIPDNRTFIKPRIILGSKTAAHDLQRVVGPNQETMARELQTLVGVDSNTFEHMLKTAKQDNDKENEDAKDEEDNGDNPDINDVFDNDDDDNNDDDDDDDDDDDVGDNDNDGDDDDDDSEDQGKNKAKGSKECDTKGKNHKENINDSKGDHKTESQDSQNDKQNVQESMKCGETDSSGWGQVSEPGGNELAIADFLNGKGKEKKPSCDPQKPVSCKRKKHKRKKKRVLLRFLKRLLTKKPSGVEPNLVDKIKEILTDHLSTTPDGLVHIFPKEKKAGYEQDALASLMRNSNNPNGRFPGTSFADNSRLEDSAAHAFTADDTTLNGPVFRISPGQAGKPQTVTDKSALLPSQLNSLSNEIHPQANDEDNKGDAKLQADILREELGRANSELEEQNRERFQDAGLDEQTRYMFNLQSLTDKWPKEHTGQVGDQDISVLSPHQIAVMRLKTPNDNPDISSPSLASTLTGKKRSNIKRTIYQKITRIRLKKASIK